MPEMDLGNGWMGDLESGYASGYGELGGNRRPLTPQETTDMKAYFASPGYISGRAEAERQAAADKDGGLFGGGLGGLLGLGLGIYGLGSLGGLWGGLGSAASTAGAAEGLGGLFGGVGSGTALTGSALGLGANGLATGIGASLGAGALGAGGAMDMGVGLQGWMDALGASAAGGGGLAAGAADASWGINSLSDNWDLFGAGNSATNPFGSGVDVGFQAPPTNLQDYITQLDKTPTGQAYLNNLLGGASDVAGGGSLVSRVLSSPSTIGKLLSTGLGMYGANQQASALQGLANKYENFGGPSRARFDASMTPGFDPMSIPGYAGALDSTSKNVLARLSATGGNPFGNPGGLIDANKQIVSGTALPAIQEYQRLNANTGFGSSMNAAVNLGTQAIGADAGGLNALGYGINALTNPQPSLSDLLKQIGGFKLNEGF